MSLQVSNITPRSITQVASDFVSKSTPKLIKEHKIVAIAILALVTLTIAFKIREHCVIKNREVQERKRNITRLCAAVSSAIKEPYSPFLEAGRENLIDLIKQEELAPLAGLEESHSELRKSLRDVEVQIASKNVVKAQESGEDSAILKSRADLIQLLCSHAECEIKKFQIKINNTNEENISADLENTKGSLKELILLEETRPLKDLASLYTALHFTYGKVCYIQSSFLGNSVEELSEAKEYLQKANNFGHKKAMELLAKIEKKEKQA
ncbi:hypothetical protein AB751O23_AA_00290 [Chlamydiales bacterium SCGC AB-751-O23]|jgi:hypothetical protein|nr:hypothetical protein AB751O23_AA_00290 [Chlamydiales bacterium SCGC AB-751-O23]